MSPGFFQEIKPTVVGTNKGTRRMGAYRHRGPQEIGVFNQLGIDNPIDGSRAKRMAQSAVQARETARELRDWRAGNLNWALAQ